mgnify:FL=1
MSEIPKRANETEKKLLNSDFSEKTFKEALKYIDKDYSPINDMRASSNYRMAVAKNLLIKVFHEINKKQLIRLN